MSAAALISISRPAAPALRSGSHPDRTLRLPTVVWSPYAGSASACITRTRRQSASSSSATIIGMAVRTPCPISERPVQIVTEPSGAISSQALGLKTVGDGEGACDVVRAGKWNPITSEAPATAPVFRNSRLPRFAWVMSHLLRRAMDRLANPLVGAAPADVGHRLIDLGVGGAPVHGQERRGGHDLPGLAVAALRHVLRDPRALHRVIAGLRQAFDGGDVPGAHGGHRGHTRPASFTVQQHGAGAALRDSTAELGAGELQRVAKHPEQGPLCRYVHCVRGSVDDESVAGHGEVSGGLSIAKVAMAAPRRQQGRRRASRGRYCWYTRT